MSLMFSREDMRELLQEEAMSDKNQNAGCFSHFCGGSDPKADESLTESERMRSTKVAIRHQRKVAAQLLLQAWDSLRNMNILRHQLGPLLKVVMERAKIEEPEKYDEKKQKKIMEIAEEYDMATWKELIQITNTRLQTHLNDRKKGWQLLTEYDIHKMESMEISIQQYPFFESFLKHFLLDPIEQEKEQVQNDVKTRAPDQTWYPMFRQSWTLAPEWWVQDHDIILMELALKHGDKWHRYGRELAQDNASNYMMRLQADDEEDQDQEGHDSMRPYLEFQYWCRQKSNILHRLKYITNTLTHNLMNITPSLVEIRIRHKHDQPKFNSKSHIFSEYERAKHKEYLQRESKLPKFKKKMPNNAASAKKEMVNNVEAPELAQAISLAVEESSSAPKAGEEKGVKWAADVKDDGAGAPPQFDRKKSQAIENYNRGLMEDEDDDSDRDQKEHEGSDDEDAKISIRRHDPFIHRNFLSELEEVIHGFNMIKYGPYMARFIVN
eukprot:863305_1